MHDIYSDVNTVEIPLKSVIFNEFRNTKVEGVCCQSLVIQFLFFKFIMEKVNEESFADTLDEVTYLTKEFLFELFSKWNSMYIVTESMKNHGMKVFINHLKEVFQDMLQSEEGKKRILMSEIEEKLKECKDLEMALNVRTECDISFDQPLAEVKKKLENALKKFENLKVQRLEEWSKLKEKEVDLCKILGFKPLTCKSTVPSEEDLERIEHYIFTLEEEKLRRYEECKIFRDEIVGYINDLEISKVFGLEKTLVEGDLQDLPLSEDGLKQLSELKESYQAEYEGAKSHAEYHLNLLKKLWLRLGTPEEFQIQFLEKHKGVGRITMEKIKCEIRRCEELKKELLTPLIKKAINEIHDLCKKLTYTDDQIAQILRYDADLLSEDVLDYYELELEKLNQLHNEYCEILDLAKKRCVIWDRMMHLEEVAKDKTRLFNNRGGQLLKEEKERKAIVQNFPKINKQLQQLLEAYQENNGSPFLFYGENLLDKITLEWQQHQAIKENKKLARKVEQKKLVEAEAILGVQNVKRKAPSTPKSETKRMKLAPAISSCESSISTTSNQSKRYATRSSKIMPVTNENSIASYSVFQEQLEQTNKTIIGNRRALKDVNSPIIFHSSPTNTPATKTPKTATKTPGTQSRIPCAKTPSTATKKWVTPRKATPGFRTPNNVQQTFSFTPSTTRFRLNI